MAAISGKDTKPEIFVRKSLFLHGFRYRKNVKNLPGKPDIVLPKYKTIIFVHGCFWHNHSCKAGTIPNTRRDFWQNKFMENKQRDNKQRILLEELGWKVIVVWECELKSKALFEARIELLIKQIKSS